MCTILITVSGGKFIEGASIQNCSNLGYCSSFLAEINVHRIRCVRTLNAPVGVLGG